MSDDAINRQEAIEAIGSWLKCKDYNEAERHIMRAAQSVLHDLPSVTPKQRTGHWIKTQAKQGGISETWYNCSECGWRNALYLPRSFCPNCGADMREEQPNEKRRISDS